MERLLHQRRGTALLPFHLVRLLMMIACISTGRAAAAAEDIELKLTPKFYNPSVVVSQGQYLVGVRETLLPGGPGEVHGRKMEREVKNFVHVCSLNTSLGLEQPFQCQNWDPWNGNFTDCVWDDQDWGKLGPTAFTGIDDTKLFVWPGRGVYGIVGRRADAVQPNTLCSHINWMQYLTQVTQDPAAAGGNQWALPRPLALTLNNDPDIYLDRTEIIEKNWMPFVHDDTLYFTYLVSPRHLVYRLVSTQGPLQLAHTSDSYLIRRAFPKKKVHGGPPAILIQAQQSNSNSSYFLGVVHFKRWVNGVLYYPHYVYKTQAEPPFRVIQVSTKELPLVLDEQVDEWNRRIVFVSGLWLDDADRIMFSYGCADKYARIMRIDLKAFEQEYLTFVAS